MMKVDKVMRVVKPIVIPNGEYDGKVTGYEVTFIANGIEYIGRASNAGVKGIGIKCKVIVKSGEITISF